MAIDFSQVKTITIPEGSVTKITDSNGNILWQGVQSEGWHTIWEGNKTCSVTKSGTNNPVVSGEERKFAHTVAGTGYTPKIRITFSYSINNTDYSNWTNKFIINQLAQTTISSPITIEAVKEMPIFGTRLCVIFCSSNDNNAYVGAELRGEKDKNNNSLNISLLKYVSNSNVNYDGHFTVTFTVTKIEQYY